MKFKFKFMSCVFMCCTIIVFLYTISRSSGHHIFHFRIQFTRLCAFSVKGQIKRIKKIVECSICQQQQNCYIWILKFCIFRKLNFLHSLDFLKCTWLETKVKSQDLNCEINFGLWTILWLIRWLRFVRINKYQLLTFSKLICFFWNARKIMKIFTNNFTNNDVYFSI